ncbi:hypothetical protein NDU88_003271 [Pleurodeles waltl]|uniref:Uncharacterized protein n=1 Tax=Pleurodeles waltl TaxID=8319 RepID=A0AAV7SFJ4_PLEWA|nr:hypothetical protein NDU88_003271 [Pleurodeles waltl]
MTAGIKGLTRDMSELGERFTRIEQTCDTHGEELDAQRHEILELHDKNKELRYQIEDLEYRFRSANICIRGILLQVVVGGLEDYVCRLFHYVALKLAPQDI